MGRIALIATLFASLVGCHQERVTSPRARLGKSIPVTRVVLYQNGVGYFERKGRVDGDVLTLQIRPSQINDLLKSLTVIDRTKGRAVSVSLPLEKTGAQILAELPAQVRDASGLLDVLSVFRGARVQVSGKKGVIAGRIVGVENMQAGVQGENAKADWRLTLKTSDNKLRVYPVEDITRVDLEDRTLSIGLDQSLDVSLNEGNWKPINLSVWLFGSRSHNLQASYIVEMPRWKPAYRLVVGKDGQPLLQGWAVVDNVSGEDWKNVKLSLVAGSPMSFIYDLHTPQFTQRPDLSPRGRTVAIAPPREAPGVSTRDRLERAKKESRRSRSRRGAAAPAAKAAPPPASEPSPDYDYESEADDFGGAEASLDEMLEGQGGPSVEGAAVGSLFRYDLQDPVTVPDRSSTLVAIVNKRVSGEEVVLFRPEITGSYGETHPYRAVMFKNDSGFALEKGPVTIYSHGTFVGEGFLERMEKGTTSFVSYSIDGNVNLSSHQGTRHEGLRLLKIIDGQIVSEVLEIHATTYDIENRHPTPITAYVKTARRQGWTLRNKPENTIETPDSYLVPAHVEANSKAALNVEWTKKVVRREGIDTTLSASLLKVYLESGKAPPAIAKKLQEVVALKRRIDEIDRETRRVEKLHRNLSTDQERVRKNLKMLGKTHGNAALRRELEQKLADQERELGKLSGQLVRFSEERAGLQAKLNVLIRTITLTVAEPEETKAAK